MATAETMYFSLDGLQTIHSNLMNAEEQLQNAFACAKSIFETLKNDESWVGQTRNEYLAFFHLVMQYHGVLIGQKMESLDTMETAEIEDNPIQMLEEALFDLIEKMEDYEENDDVEEYKELRKIQ